MTDKKFDILVFIGRFQPFHLGHKSIVDRALQQADSVLLFVGSANVSRSVKNPFTYEERCDMITACYPDETSADRLRIRPLNDVLYNDTAWIASVQASVMAEALAAANGDASVHLHGLKDFRIGLIGHMKDSTGYYQKMFPEWASLDVQHSYGTFGSTHIRNDYFRPSPMLPNAICPEPVVDWLHDFRLTPEFAGLVEEKNYIDDYREQWKSAPYPPVFVTVDAVVIQSGHILLVERGEQPGRGLKALPGGFVNQDERLRAAAIRELREETRISDAKGELPPAMLGSFIEDRKTRVFDNPDRSGRGRTITHAYLFNCPERKKLFRVSGADDARHAAWYELGTLDPREFFEDHWAIIQEMTGV